MSVYRRKNHEFDRMLAARADELGVTPQPEVSELFAAYLRLAESALRMGLLVAKYSEEDRGRK